MASSSTYWPDFLVWVDKAVVAIDTKGDHLLAEASVGKLFDIDTLGEPAKVVLRLISEGEAEALPSGQINRIGKHGFTVWSWKNGRLNGIHAADEKTAVRLALDLA